MEKQVNKYKYSQLEVYKESLELTHMIRKTIVVNAILVVLMFLLGYFLFTTAISGAQVYPSLLMFGILIMMNIMFSSFTVDRFNNLKLAMYITVIGIYVIAITLVFTFETPSIFTVLFLAYAITSIYQDYKSMLLSSFVLLFSGSILVISYPDIFRLVQESNPQSFYILVFLLIFVTLLTLSSYILIKRKTFFYNQLASIKESEIRNIELLNEVEFVKTNKKRDYSDYYPSLGKFSKELSKKIGVDDLFNRRIMLLKDLRKHKPVELLDRYPDFTLKEIENLVNMEIEISSKISNLGIKASKSKDIEVSKKEIFNESQFKSFNHFGDSLYTKIISFSVFYTLLKLDKPYLKAIDEEKLRDILYNSEYFYRIDRDIVNIYLENSDVFDTIVNDYLRGGF